MIAASSSEYGLLQPRQRRLQNGAGEPSGDDDGRSACFTAVFGSDMPNPAHVKLRVTNEARVP